MFKAFSLIYERKKSAVSVAVFLGIIKALTPYLYIFAVSIIVTLLTANEDLQVILFAAGIAVFLQMLFSVLGYWLSNLQMENQDWFNMYEKNQITKSLLHMEYDKLDGTDLERKVLQHRDELSREGGILNKYLSIIEIFFSSIFGLATAIISLLPFIIGLFKSEGTTFFDSTSFGILIITLTLVAVALLFVIKGKVEQGNVALRSKYAKHNFIFSYYNNLICNYKTGKEIRIFNQSPFIMNQVSHELIDQGVPLQQKIATRYGFAAGLSDWIFAVMTFGFMLLVGVRSITRNYSIGEALAYIGCFRQLTGGFGNLSGIWGKWKALAPRAELYESILKMAEINDKKMKKCPQTFHEIKFENVDFSYQTNSEPALQNFSITIYSGEKISIVGENGSGKTTFVKLLCNLHKPVSGRITLDGTDISDFDTEDYQNLFSVVFQDSNLFSLPLGENIAASATVDNEQAKKYLTQVGFTEKYTLDTMIYQDCDSNGVNLSGGEVQKLTLARSLYRNKPIIILDEPTAMLDPYAEFRLYEQFNSLTKGKTAIYISHRLSSCRFCDKIAVLDHGKLIQFGTHNELIQNKSGKYYKLWSAQAKYYQNKN